jgi:hypothetical protein
MHSARATNSAPQAWPERALPEKNRGGVEDLGAATIAASSIHGTGAQYLVSALRSGRNAMSGVAFGPDSAKRLCASTLVMPVRPDRLLGEALDVIYLVSTLRIAFNSSMRFAVVLGYAIFRPLNVSRTIWETIKRAFSLSSAGTAYQGA